MARLRIRNEFELEDLVDQLGRPPDLVARDFALMTIAARLTEAYADELCFKGGFVLRHVHGHARFSRDIDATRVRPPKHKLDANEVTAEITRARAGSLVAIRAAPPATDSGRSLDFERVDFTSSLSDGRVSVEISYREDVLDPRIEQVGPPYFDPFSIAVLSLEEIVAEKLRALCQRTRPTDLADQAMILARAEHDPARVRELAAEKFKLVKTGDHRDRIAQKIADMGATYDDAVHAVAPDAPSYREASALVLAQLGGLLP
jgi:predicted nucleotidyltransferase component of viral defense system